MTKAALLKVEAEHFGKLTLMACRCERPTRALVAGRATDLTCNRCGCDLHVTKEGS